MLKILKNKKGITMITLTITVVILIILTSVSIGAGYTVVKDIRAGRVISNMALIKAKVETIYEQYQFSNDASVLVGTLSGTMYITDKEKNLMEEKAGNNNFAGWTWYKWDKDTIKSQGLSTDLIENDAVYYVNYENGEILYSKGISYDNNTYYYSLTGLNYIYQNN